MSEHRIHQNRILLQKTVLSAMFLALGMTLPFLTAQLPAIGKMLAPMHPPVFLCGMICGWPCGMAVGLVLPILRSLAFGFPVMVPEAFAMSFELATYGLLSGILFPIFSRLLRGKTILPTILSLLPSMLLGRSVWGLARLSLAMVTKTRFTVAMFLSIAFLYAIPGLIIQLILVPGILYGLRKAHLIPLDKG